MMNVLLASQENQARHFIQQRFTGLIAPLHVRALRLCVYPGSAFAAAITEVSRHAA